MATKRKLRIPKTVTYRGKRRRVIGHYVSQEFALAVADERGGLAICIPRYDPYYLVMEKPKRR